MADDMEQPELTGSPIDLCGNVIAPGIAEIEQRQIDDRQTRRTRNRTCGLLEPEGLR